jgi:hypothetical protein
MPEQPMSLGPQRTEKPFPWRCPKCRELTVSRVTMPYRCQRKHRGRVVTVDVPNLAVPRCSNCGEVVFDYTADEQIRAAFQGRLDADAKKTQTISKVVCFGSAAFFFTLGLFFLFNGESVMSLIWASFTMWALLVKVVTDVRMRTERIEDHLLNRPNPW